MATEEIWAFNSQNNQNEIIQLLSQDVNLTQETKRGLQKHKKTIVVPSRQKMLEHIY